MYFEIVTGRAFPLVTVASAGGLLGLLALRGKGARMNDKIALFTLAHLPAQLMGLAIGHPMRVDVTARHGGGPKQQDVDAAIGGAFVTERKRCRARCPARRPRAGASFQQGDDLVGDFLIHVETVGGAGCVPGGVAGHNVVSLS
jgi:hypothetical protein